MVPICDEVARFGNLPRCLEVRLLDHFLDTTLLADRRRAGFGGFPTKSLGQEATKLYERFDSVEIYTDLLSSTWSTIINESGIDTTAC